MELVVPGLVTIIALIAIVAGLLLGVYWLMGLYAVHSRKQEDELPEVELPSHLHEIFTGLPIFVTLFCIGIAVCMIAYVLSVWAFGVSY